MAAVNLLSGALILFIGLIIRIFKLSGLIAGYNTSSKEQKEKYDEDKIIRFVSNMLFASSAVLILGGVVNLFVDSILIGVYVTWGIFTTIILGSVIYMNTGNRMMK